MTKHLVLAACFVAALGVLASCEHGRDGGAPRIAPSLSLADAIAVAERATGAVAYAAHFENEPDDQAYEIRLVRADGETIEVEVDLEGRSTIESD